MYNHNLQMRDGPFGIWNHKILGFMYVTVTCNHRLSSAHCATHDLCAWSVSTLTGAWIPVNREGVPRLNRCLYM